MTPFDGKFASDYVLPLAAAAYDSTQAPQGFARSWEIVADTAVVSAAKVQAHSSLAPSLGHTAELNAMMLQPRKPLTPEELQQPQVAAAAVAAVAPNLHFGWVTADTNKNTLVIAIRGTQFLSEWLKDFDLLPAPYTPVPAPLRLVHQGFLLVYQAIRTSLLAQIAAARAAFPSIKTVLVTGHSLGAAVVGVAAPDLIPSHLHGLAPLVYTFAEPRVGNPSYASFYNQTVPVCYRVNNIWDVVPHLPPILAVYEHEGVQVDINSGFHWSVAENHQIATGYIPGMAAWVAQHAAAPSAREAGQMPSMIGVVA